MEQTRQQPVDSSLLSEFESEIWSRLSHLEEGRDGPKVTNPTPPGGHQRAVEDCTKSVYDLDLDGKQLVVLGKLESKVPGGSIKSRPAMEIVRDAIASGTLRRGRQSSRRPQGISA